MTTESRAEPLSASSHAGWPVARYAIFVDAGYLLAAGSFVATGTRDRGEVEIDYAGLIGAIMRFTRDDCGLDLLRLYWYDGAINRWPQPDQRAIARLDDVKLRLGSIQHGRQKGVDSLLLRDVMTLSRERAIVAAYIVGGDEDIHEAITVAQDLGVRVTLLGTTTPVTTESQRLVEESDRFRVLPPDAWQAYFRSRQGREAASESVQSASTLRTLTAELAPIGESEQTLERCVETVRSLVAKYAATGRGGEQLGAEGWSLATLSHALRAVVPDLHPARFGLESMSSFVSYALRDSEFCVVRMGAGAGQDMRVRRRSSATDAASVVPVSDPVADVHSASYYRHVLARRKPPLQVPTRQAVVAVGNALLADPPIGETQYDMVGRFSRTCQLPSGTVLTVVKALLTAGALTVDDDRVSMTSQMQSADEVAASLEKFFVETLESILGEVDTAIVSRLFGPDGEAATDLADGNGSLAP